MRDDASIIVLKTWAGNSFSRFTFAAGFLTIRSFHAAVSQSLKSWGRFDYDCTALFTPLLNGSTDVATGC